MINLLGFLRLKLHTGLLTTAAGMILGLPLGSFKGKMAVKRGSEWRSTERSEKMTQPKRHGVSV